MTAFYICAIFLAPMLFMGMIPSAHAQDTEKADTGVSGPGKLPHMIESSRAACPTCALHDPTAALPVAIGSHHWIWQAM